MRHALESMEAMTMNKKTAIYGFSVFMLLLTITTGSITPIEYVCGLILIEEESMEEAIND